MAEPTSELSANDLRASIGAFLGYGRGAVFSEPAWTTAQQNNINAVLRSALNQVYVPLIPGSNEVYAWSWLRPQFSLPLTQDVSLYDLPDDFGGFHDELYVSTTGQSSVRYLVKVSTPEMVQRQYAVYPNTTGVPTMAAELPLKSKPFQGQRGQLYVWPIPDQGYTLEGVYYYIPAALTELNPYPPGGATLSELFHASCRAAAERELDDENGVAKVYFQERLLASIGADRKRKGRSLGYNGDRSDANGTRADRDGGRGVVVARLGGAVPT